MILAQSFITKEVGHLAPEPFWGFFPVSFLLLASRIRASSFFPRGHLFFSAGISLCTFSGTAFAAPFIRAILPLRTMR